MARFGLIGKSLTHSFSKQYFDHKWDLQGDSGNQYDVFELDSIVQFPELIVRNKDLLGLNVTIPYKETIIPWLDQLTPTAQAIGAVNCIRIVEGILVGHNTDTGAFQKSLEQWLPPDFEGNALVLGSGGASKAVCYSLNQMKIPYTVVSRQGAGMLYDDLLSAWNTAWRLIINTTPLGMWPNIHTKPNIPYSMLDKRFYLYDLVYNPEKTLFLALGGQQNCHLKNGLEMLQLQAEESWHFWNQSMNYGRT